MSRPAGSNSPSHLDDWDQQSQPGQDDYPSLHNESSLEYDLKGYDERAILIAAEHQRTDASSQGMPIEISTRHKVRFRSYDVLYGRGIPNKLRRGIDVSKALVKETSMSDATGSLLRKV